MIIIPAIDLMDGKCVRLVQGKRENMLNYDKTPLEIAEEYWVAGARLIHVVDLDGAFTGEMKNLEIIRSLAKRFPIQVGGGVRSEAAIKTLLAAGVQKVVVSTLLMKDPDLASELKKKYYEKLIGSFDFKDGKLAYAGWTAQTERKFEDVACGLAEIVVTDTSRDGTFRGPNLDLLGSVVPTMQKCDTNVVSAGGILNVDDLLSLKRAGVYGAIVGRALLDGKITLKEVLERVM